MSIRWAQEGAVEVQEYPRAAPQLVQLVQLLRGSTPEASVLTAAVPGALPAFVCEAAALALMASLPVEDTLLGQVLQATNGGGGAEGPQMHAWECLNMKPR